MVEWETGRDMISSSTTYKRSYEPFQSIDNKTKLKSLTSSQLQHKIHIELNVTGLINYESRKRIQMTGEPVEETLYGQV